MPLEAGQPRAQVAQVVIDLTGSDDEAPLVQPQSLGPFAHTANSLPQVPTMQHGLPIFEAGPGNLETRYGASGQNYSQAPLQSTSRPLAAGTTSNFARPSPSNNRQSSVRHSLPMYGGFSNPPLLLPHGVANDRENPQKRRKTVHDSGTRSQNSDSTSLYRKAAPALQRTAHPMIDLTSTPAYGRTVIAGGNTDQPDTRLLPPSKPGVLQRPEVRQPAPAPASHQNQPVIVDSELLTLKVIEFINVALKPYRDLSAEERKSVIEKTAEHLIDPLMKAEYESNNGEFSKQYEREVIKLAKTYVDTYLQTRKELQDQRLAARTSGSFHFLPGYNGFTDREESSTSSSVDGIFERQPASQHLSSAGRKRPYSESPSTELSNDAIDGVVARNHQTDRGKRVNPASAPSMSSLRRSERATRQDSQPSYVFKRRRRNLRSDYASESPACDTLAMDLDDESVMASPVADIGDVDDVEDVVQPIQKAKIPNSFQSEKLLLTLLRQRESDGMAPAKAARGRPTFKASTYANLEDSLMQQSEWTDCSGDIVSISWITADAFLCGALAHLDPHNMQYNKPGNLLLGSTVHDTVRSFPNHRVPRPVVAENQNAENARESMRQTQDPWIYPSVVSTAHSPMNEYSFTSSFDQTVKIWSVCEDGSSMDLVGTWQHEAKVNFVVTSEHHERVATASALSNNAVRVYDLDKNSVLKSKYYLYGGNKAQEQTQDKWSYQPATIQWGRAARVANLLLVGYSPRSDTDEDMDIPVEKKNTGELCVWNVETKAPIHIGSSKSQNVFEVKWHPSQPIFVAATSPSGIFDSGRTKTQIRIFTLNESEIFTESRKLDCPALDINELTVMPNSLMQCYVTASCTDGATYVYDTAQGEEAIHILAHDKSLEALPHDLEVEVADEGVKFAAWGQCMNRLYTGSSDGKLKAWDIRRPPGRAFVRDVLTLSGGIASGVFSKDFSKLALGDATGKVHLMSTDDSDLESSPIATRKDEVAESIARTSELSTANPTIQQVRQQRNALLSEKVRRPKVIIQHAEPPPPDEYDIQESTQTSVDMALHYLNEGILEQHKGVGVYQGPNYAESGWFRYEAHEGNDSSQPLLPQFLAQQQCVIRQKESETKFECLPRVVSSDKSKHEENARLDLVLAPETREALLKDKVEIEEDFHLTYKYDLLPNSSIFKSSTNTVESEERGMDGVEMTG